MECEQIILGLFDLSREKRETMSVQKKGTTKQRIVMMYVTAMAIVNVVVIAAVVVVEEIVVVVVVKWGFAQSKLSLRNCQATSGA